MVWAFIGLVGWYSKFIFHFAERTAPVTDLTKALAPNQVKWTKDLRSAITNDSALHSQISLSLPHCRQMPLECGIGAELQQEVEGERRSVVCLSRKLQEKESRYSTVEKECLAWRGCMALTC